MGGIYPVLYGSDEAGGPGDGSRGVFMNALVSGVRDCGDVSNYGNSFILDCFRCRA